MVTVIKEESERERGRERDLSRERERERERDPPEVDLPDRAHLRPCFLSLPTATPSRSLGLCLTLPSPNSSLSPCLPPPLHVYTITHHRQTSITRHPHSPRPSEEGAETVTDSILVFVDAFVLGTAVINNNSKLSVT